MTVPAQASGGCPGATLPLPPAAMAQLSAEGLAQVAAYFQALAEPTRLLILNLLRQQPQLSVGELAQRCGCSVANVSRHLALLTQRGLVARESRGTSAHYRIADASIDPLCELVCVSLARRWQLQATLQQDFAAAPDRGDEAAAPAVARQALRGDAQT